MIRVSNQEGREVDYMQANATSIEDMLKIAEFTVGQYGRIAVLINRAGIIPNELEIHDWDQLIDVNIKKYKVKP